MAKNKCPDCPKCLPGWLVQFGDLMSLLLCFFILLLSMGVKWRIAFADCGFCTKVNCSFLGCIEIDG